MHVDTLPESHSPSSSLSRPSLSPTAPPPHRHPQTNAGDCVGFVKDPSRKGTSKRARVLGRQGVGSLEPGLSNRRVPFAGLQVLLRAPLGQRGWGGC
ncbi:hypothetical protein VULLAG_LOCUS20827 [Vulpes lagopus]